MAGRLRTPDSRAPIPSVTPLSPKTHRTPRLARQSSSSSWPLVALAASLALAAPAGAITPCGKKVLDDWWDNGRVDRLYPLHCYEEAIDASRRTSATTRTPRQSSRARCRRPSAGSSRRAATTRRRTTIPAIAIRRARPGGPDDPGSTDGGSEAAPDVDGGTSSVPIPLLVLGGMSLALLAAGGLGYLSRRRQAAEGQDDENHPLDPLA